MFESWLASSTSTVRTFAQLESRRSLAHLAALFLDLRRASGSYPESIEAAAGAAEILDPLTGGPFALRRDQEGVVLHSRWQGATARPHPSLGLISPGKEAVEWRLPADR